MRCAPTPFAAALVATLAPCLAQSPGFWERRPSLKTARQEVGAAVLDGKVYVAGGLATNRSVLKSVERYDPKTKTWSATADLPTTLHHFGMSALGGKIYVIGGYVSGFTGTNKCFRYDPKTNKWSAIANLPRPRGALVAAALGGKIYAFGGVVPRAGAVGDLTVYDPKTNKWTTLASMTYWREHLAGAALGGRLYAVGGRRGGNFRQLEEYDPTTNKWTRKRDMPTARGGLGAATLNGKLIVVGGEFPGIFPQTEEYDPKTNTWRSLERMRPGMHGIYPVTIGDEIMVAGGATVAGYGAVNIVQSLRLYPTGVAPYGAGTPSCNGNLEVHVSHRPVAGEAKFSFLSTGLPKSTFGLFAIGIGQDVAGSTILGFRTHLDLGKPIVVFPATSDGNGKNVLRAPLPAGAKGVRDFVQFVWANTATCGGAGSTSSSHGLDITIR